MKNYKYITRHDDGSIYEHLIYNGIHAYKCLVGPNYTIPPYAYYDTSSFFGVKFDVEKEVYKMIIENGEHKELYDNGQLKKHCYYKNNMLTGEYIEYYDNGQIKIEANYINDVLNGEYKEWFSDGQIKVKSNYINGNEIYDCSKDIIKTNKKLKSKDNWKCSYLDYDKRFQSRFYYNMHMAYEGFYGNGKLYARYFAKISKNHEKDWECNIWYENGQLQLSCNYKDDKLDGDYKEYYMDGKLKIYANFVDDELIECKKYDNPSSNKYDIYGREYKKIILEDGSVEQYYIKDGKKKGEYKKWHPNGELQLYCWYEDDKLNGEYREYYKKGTGKIECYYQDGKLDGKYLEWYENCNPHIRCNYKNGKLDGTREVYTRSGKFDKDASICYRDGKDVNDINYEQYNIKNDKKDGEYKELYPNGQLKIQCYYQDGKLDGQYMEWYNNGNLHISCHYTNGERDSSYEVYTIFGTLDYDASIYHDSEKNNDCGC